MRSILIIFPLIYYFVPSLFAQVHVGGGGDTYAIQFIDVARTAHDELKKRGSSLIRLELLLNTINTAAVESTDKNLYLNGSLKDAINYPTQQKIIFNRKAWKDAANQRTRLLFVLHEYLGLMGVNDSRYDISSEALKNIAQATLICRSILENGHNQIEISGKVALDLTGQPKARWSDGIRDYGISLNAITDPAFFVLGISEVNSDVSSQVVTAYISKSKPAVSFVFTVETMRKINGYPIKFVNVECQ